MNYFRKIFSTKGWHISYNTIIILRGQIWITITILTYKMLILKYTFQFQLQGLQGWSREFWCCFTKQRQSKVSLDNTVLWVLVSLLESCVIAFQTPRFVCLEPKEYRDNMHDTTFSDMAVWLRAPRHNNSADRGHHVFSCQQEENRLPQTNRKWKRRFRPTSSKITCQR